jgi:hypothetical protein
MEQKLIGSELPLVERLRKMKGMGDYQLAALMDGVGPRAADEIERLQAFVAHLAVPAGYKLVPIRPTEEMLKAGVRAWWDNPEIEDGAPEEMLRPYRAMLAAAPEVTPNDQINRCA